MRLGLPGGRVEPGAPANLTLIDPLPESRLKAGELYYRHQQSAFVGRPMRGRIARTILRGRTVALNGKPLGDPQGRLVRPQPLLVL
jgi:dihydroorotase-like cyclic amidohydrolase